jgi:hypothetical protein
VSDLHCGDCGSTNVVDGAAKSRRSLPQLKRYHAMIRAAFHHWPEKHERQFDSEEDLRKFLQMKAGHREVAASFAINGFSKNDALMIAEASIKAAGSYAVPVMHGETLVIFKPKSIAFHKLGHSDFCKLNDDVDAVILAETGIKGETMLKEMEKAA